MSKKVYSTIPFKAVGVIALFGFPFIVLFDFDPYSKYKLLLKVVENMVTLNITLLLGVILSVILNNLYLQRENILTVNHEFNGLFMSLYLTPLLIVVVYMNIYLFQYKSIYTGVLIAYVFNAIIFILFVKSKIIKNMTEIFRCLQKEQSEIKKQKKDINEQLNNLKAENLLLNKENKLLQEKLKKFNDDKEFTPIKDILKLIINRLSK